MSKITSMREALNMLCTKGEAILVTGTTGCGKTCSFSALTDFPIAQLYISMGEADGKGTSINKLYVASDAEVLPDDGIVFCARLVIPTAVQFNDECRLLGECLYAYTNGLVKNHKKPEEKIGITLRNQLENLSKDNTSLITLMRNTLQNPAKMEQLARQIGSLSEDQRHVCISIYQHIASQGTKGQKTKRKFISEISSNAAMRPYIDSFMNMAEQFVCEEVNQVRQILTAGGAVFEPDNEAFYIRFEADIFDEVGKPLERDLLDDSQKPIHDAAMLLLHSEADSSERLLENAAVVFKGRKELFDLDAKGCFVIADDDGETQPVRSVRFVDTMGLFHKKEEVSDEAERIIDLTKQFHATQIILAINSYINNTVKDGYLAVKEFLRIYNGEVKIYPLFTHWDQYLSTFAPQAAQTAASGRSNRFGRQVSVDWNKCYHIAKAQQDALLQEFRKDLEENPSRRKPTICCQDNGDTFRSCIISDNSPMEDVLRSQEVEYHKMWEKMFPCLIADRTALANKRRVDAAIMDHITVDCTLQSNPVSVNKLRDNLHKCIGKTEGGSKLWYFTVDAVRRKWRYNGKRHKAIVSATYDGYTDIETNFIPEMVGFANVYLPHLVYDRSFAKDPAQFDTDLREYLKRDNNFGREFAKVCYEYAAEYVENGRKNNDAACVWEKQYEHVNRLFHCVDRQFYTTPIAVDPGSELGKMLNDAAARCVQDFLDIYCITY